MYEPLVPRVLEYYGVSYDRILPVQKGYRNEIYPVHLNDESMVQLTFYKREEAIVERMSRADSVSSYVADKGVPARRRIDNRTVHLKNSQRDVYAGLYNYLPGTTIAWEAYTQGHIKLLGRAMSDLHDALSDFPASGPLVIDECQALLERMIRYFEDESVSAAMNEKLKLSIASLVPFKEKLDKCYELPAQQLHMDFVRGNILFSNEDIAVTGILDFEKTAVGHPVFDVARTLAFLLVDCKYKTEDQIRRYFLQSGYTKRGKATLDYYPHLLETLITFFLIHDFYKFLRHTPYESLEANEHYVRTRYMLVNRGMLHYV